MLARAQKPAHVLALCWNPDGGGQALKAHLCVSACSSPVVLIFITSFFPICRMGLSTCVRCYSHLTKRKTKTQRDRMTCPGSPS